MTGKRREPDPSRLSMTTGEAARVLQILPITVRRRVERGELEGGQKPSGKWYVYADQVDRPSPTRGRASSAGREASAKDERLASENAELRRQLADLAALPARNAQLEAENRELRRTHQVQQAALSDMQEVLEEYLEGGESALIAATKFQSAGRKLSRINASLNEHLALAAIPDTAAELDDNR